MNEFVVARMMEVQDNSSNTVQYKYLSDAQYIAAFAVAIISCTLSLFGSLSIIYIILKTKKWKELYHRLMFGLSFMDLIVTTGLLLIPFFMPHYTGYMFAQGNEATCNAIAFLMQYTVASYIYNAELSIYFLLMIRYGRSEKELSRRLEPYVHIIPMLTATLFGIIGVSLDVFGPNPVLGTCTYESFEYGCKESTSEQCERENMAYGIMWAHSLATIIAMLIGVVCTWLIYWTVRQQANRNRRWATSRPNEAEQKRMKAVGLQAIWYTTAALVGFLALFLAFIMRQVYLDTVKDEGEVQNTAGLFVAYFLVRLIFPLQGFFNWLIYIRPRIVRWRSSNPDRSWFWAYRQVLSGKPAPVITSRKARQTASTTSTIQGQKSECCTPDASSMVDAERLETATKHPSVENNHEKRHEQTETA